MDGFNTYTVVGHRDSDGFAVATAVIPGEVTVTVVDDETHEPWSLVVRADSVYDAANLAVNEVEA